MIALVVQWSHIGRKVAYSVSQLAVYIHITTTFHSHFIQN